ncbi:MAG TPA: M20/M25/M40 family metallo-hydrolase [Blastocatellia bacterium]|jgi:hypothetical protein|nr:M20/M25/M40 family metallo-hydrolase [Blastocatellia bacterium]
MSQATAISQPASWPSRRSGDASIGLVTFLFVAFLSFLTISQLRAPARVTASAPAGDFSSERAMKHVETIAQAPRPVGSPAKAAIRDYLIGTLTRFGLTPDVQRTTSVMQRGGDGFQAATIENVVTRLNGTAGGKAVLLVAHYDSVPVGPGANDDGAGVAGLLETLRAIKAGPPLKNDVIALFSDGEEIGLLGARAFVEEHPWAHDVGVVLNYDARGGEGPALMFETSDKNKWLIDEFARTAPHPFANSVSNEIYKLMQYGSDLTAFKKAGIPGLNFAYVDGVNHYHNRIDDLANTDERNLQHFGSYALALARGFGNIDLEKQSQGNAVYFDIFGTLLIRYSIAWSPILAALTALLFFGVAFMGFRKKILKPTCVFWGFAASVVCLIAAPLAVIAAWWLVQLTNVSVRIFPQGDVYNSKIYIAAFTALAIAIISSTLILFQEKAGENDLALGGYLCLLIPTILVSLSLPGAGYLFVWPLLFGLIGLAVSFVYGDRDLLSKKRLITSLIAASPGLILLPPLIYLVFVALTVSFSAPAIVLTAWLLILISPLLSLIARARKWILPLGSFAAFAVFIIMGHFTSSFDSRHPKPDSLFYLMSDNLKKAIWVSLDRIPDQWTGQYLSKDAKHASIGDFIGTPYATYLQNEAPLLPYAAPNAEVLEDQSAEGVRSLRLRITSNRQAPIATIYVQTEGQTLNATVNGKSNGAQLRPQWAFEYCGLPKEGIELGLRVNSSRPIKIQVADQTFGLPEIPGVSVAPRPDYLMPVNFPNSDSTMVCRAFIF